jgi:hypothetical protein
MHALQNAQAADNLTSFTPRLSVIPKNKRLRSFPLSLRETARVRGIDFMSPLRG